MRNKKVGFDVFDFGYETLKNVPKITAIGKNKVYVENFDALIEYNTDSIRLKSKNCIVGICGEDFKIKNIREDSIEVFGSISEIQFI